MSKDVMDSGIGHSWADWRSAGSGVQFGNFSDSLHPLYNGFYSSVSLVLKEE